MQRVRIAIVALTILLMGVAKASFDPCEISERLALEAASLDVVGVGDVLLVGAGAEGLMVFEDSGDAGLALVGLVRLEAPAGAISRDGDKLLAGSTLLDISDPRQPTVLSRLDVGSNVIDCVIWDNRAVVSHPAVQSPSLPQGLTVFDVSDPGSPVKIGSLSISGAGALAAHDGMVGYVGTSGGGIIDLGASWPPAAVTPLPSGEYISSLVFDGEFLYAAKSSLLNVYGVSNPAQPILLTQRSSSGSTLAMHGNVLVQSGGKPTFFDVTDPAQPIEIGRMFGGTAQSVFLDSDRLVHATGLNGLLATDLHTLDEVDLRVGALQDSFGAFAIEGNLLVASTVSFSNAVIGVYDVSDPGTPVQIGRSVTHGSARGIDLMGDTLVCYWDSEVFFMDLSQLPGLPVLARMPMDFVSEIRVDGSRVIVPSYADGIKVLDASDPNNPVVAVSIAGIGPMNAAIAHGDLLFAAGASPPRMLVIDIGDPDNPQVLSTLGGFQGTAQSLVRNGNVVFYHNSTEMAAIDVSDPESPEMMSSVRVPFSGSNRRVQIDNNLMLIQSSSRYQVIDVSDPFSIRLVSEYPARGATSGGPGPVLTNGRFWALDGGSQIITGSIPGLLAEMDQRVSMGSQSPLAVAADVGHLYLSGLGGNMTILDRDTLAVRSVIDLPYDGRGIALDGNMLYMTSGGELLAFDVSDPSSPRVVGSAESSVDGPLSISGQTAAAAGHEVRGFDLSDPISPITGGRAQLPANAVDACAIGTTFYLACGNAGMQVVDASDPYFPINRQGFLPGTGSVLSVAASEGRVYMATNVSSSDNGWVLDVSNPFLPKLVSTFRSAAHRMIRASDGFLYSATTSRVRVFDISDPDVPLLIQEEIPIGFVSPNLWVFEDIILGMDGSGRFRVLLRDGCSEPCPADLAPPFGVLDFFDVVAFLDAFGSMSTDADLAAPFGVWNFFDVSEFVRSFSEGCDDV
jgi:hypothetical protein